MGTAWETRDKPALPPTLAQHRFLSTSRAGLKGFCQGCSDSCPQESVLSSESLVSLGSVYIPGMDQSRSLICD